MFFRRVVFGGNTSGLSEALIASISHWFYILRFSLLTNSPRSQPYLRKSHACDTLFFLVYLTFFCSCLQLSGLHPIKYIVSDYVRGWGCRPLRLTVLIYLLTRRRNQREGSIVRATNASPHVRHNGEFKFIWKNRVISGREYILRSLLQKEGGVPKETQHCSPPGAKGSREREPALCSVYFGRRHWRYASKTSYLIYQIRFRGRTKYDEETLILEIKALKISRSYLLIHSLVTF